MHPSTAPTEPIRTWVCRSITAILAVAAGMAISFGIRLAVGPADTEPLESPLMLVVARQLDLGPWALYGPYGRQNPLVLIHAPLYYQLAAVLARPVHFGGIDPITAARLAGRALSLAGFLLAGWAAFRIARLDCSPPRAGWWTLCLFASAPVLGAMPFTVRPDMLGVGLQTTGVWLILRALNSPRGATANLTIAFALFALAVFTKQHLVGGPLISTVLLLVAAHRGKIKSRAAALGVLTGAAVMAALYVVEEVNTEGRMSQAIFLAAAATARVHPTDWLRAAIVVSNIGGASSCLIVLLTLAGLAQVNSKRGYMRAAFALIGTLVAASTLLLPLVHQFRPSMLTNLAMSAAPFVCLFGVVPACALFERRGTFGNKLDAALWLFAAAEIAILVPLCRASTGAWVNYAIQGIVFLTIITARALSRACAAARPRSSLVAIAVTALFLVFFELKGVYNEYVRNRFDRLSTALVLSNLTERTADVYFAGEPGKNRQFGRADLVFDPWLYPVFEAIHAAEPRSSWLRAALADGSVRFVVTASNDPRIDGVNEPLPSLGYAARFEIASQFVWEQIRIRNRPAKIPDRSGEMDQGRRNIDATASAKD